MQRRTVLKSLAALPGVAPVAEALAQTPQGSPPMPPRSVKETPQVTTNILDLAGDPVPHFFNSLQYSALTRLSDMIVPAVEGNMATPGAIDARVPQFLDFLIGQSPAPRQNLYRDGLDRLNAVAKSRAGKSFAELSAADADAALAPLRQAWTYDAPQDVLAAFLRTAKEEILNATVNSYEWSSVVSKRSRNASGVAAYWSVID